MPRQPDPGLENRILNAARKLFLNGGEKGLSMRILAKAAHTNTPAVYRRFRNRKEILGALVQRSQQDLLAVLESCVSLQDAYHLLLAFALAHPHEYRLINAGVFSNVSVARPDLEFLKRLSAEWFGGSPEDHTSLVLALWALVHGAATLLLSKAVPLSRQNDLHSVLDKAVELLVQNRSVLSNKLEEGPARVATR
ncbi:MAG TPA: TetR/AcrR family transcriptional regulator [Terriglobales bacterium]|nr:TetR/AcrR family transcriptional regulator [Terriglobales bacterium]